ncbi:MAG: hypothetical protein J6Q79_07405 [Clostridia bacterium]|nr:hypothetical protein [Clostridia bacterium]
MRCTKCNVDLADSYSRCPLCGSAATDEPAKLQGIKEAPYSKTAPVKEENVPKAEKNFSLEKLKAYFNL